MIPLWSIPFAVGTGNTLVLKPSERTTGASMIIAECVILFLSRPLELTLARFILEGLLGKLVREPDVRTVRRYGHA